MRESRRLRWILAPYLIVVTLIVGYNAHAIAQQRGSAVVVNVAARQRALSERYTKDVILRTQGIAADPQDDAEQLRANADALLHGGEVTAVQGADATVVLHGADDRLVIAKLDEEQRLIAKLLDAGDQLLPMSPTTPGYETRLQELRVLGGQVNSISNDAVGQITRDAEAAFARLVAIGIGLGVLGAIAAVAMGLLLRRTAATQAAQFRSLVHNATDLITVVDASGAIRYQSPSAEPVLGRSAEELLGTSYLGSLDAADRAHLDAVFRELAATPGAVATAEYRVRHVDGSWRYVESIVTNRMDDPNVRGLVLNTRDVTDRRALQDELAHQAFHDPLTGLVNRAVFRDRVDHAVARAARLHQQPAVLLLDLDGFKTVNDGLGHDAGDELLVAVGHRLQASGRSIDTVARIGGDEFAILLEDDAQTAGARTVAERVLAVLTTPVPGPRPGGLRPGEHRDRHRGGGNDHRRAAPQRRRGDVRRQARRQGALRVLRADHARGGAARSSRSRATWIAGWRTRSSCCTTSRSSTSPPDPSAGVEALVRWRHPDARAPAARRSSSRSPRRPARSCRSGRGCCARRAGQTAEWRRSDPARADLWVSVNLSTRQLLEANLVTAVRESLARERPRARRRSCWSSPRAA